MPTLSAHNRLLKRDRNVVVAAARVAVRTARSCLGGAKRSMHRVKNDVVAKFRIPLSVWYALPLGPRHFECTICGGRFRRFLPCTGHYSIRGEMLDHYTENAQCPGCQSGIRHRFIFKFLQDALRPVDKKILHFAPEPAIYGFFKSRPGTKYFPCDIQPQTGSDWHQVDITSIRFADAEFDLTLCIHVLEHIVDDRRAIAELYRVTKPGGRLILAVPTYGETTYEDPTLDEAGRARMFGIADHRRLNGLDLRHKLSAAGFHVRVVSIDDVPGRYLDRTARSPHIDSDKYLFVCDKPIA